MPIISGFSAVIPILCLPDTPPFSLVALMVRAFPVF